MVTVMVVDSHPVFRRGLVSVLRDLSDLDLIGEAADFSEAAAKAGELQPTVIIVDFQMMQRIGVEAVAALRRDAPDTGILTLTASEERKELFAAMRMGARGYLLKHIEVGELLAAVRVVALGGVVISPTSARILLDHAGLPNKPANASGVDVVSLREKAVLQRVASGASNSEIAAQLFVSVATVKAHLRSIMRKLQVRNRAQAVAKAVGVGLLEG